MKYALFLMIPALLLADDPPKPLEPAKVPAEIELAYVRAVANEEAAIAAATAAIQAKQAASKGLLDFCASKGQLANYNAQTRVATCVLKPEVKGESK